LEEELQGKMNEMTKITEELGSLHEDIKQKESHHGEATTQKEQEIQTLQTTVQEKEQILVTVNEELSQIKSEKEKLLEDQQQKETHIVKLESQIESLKQENQVLSSSSSELEGNITKYKEAAEQERQKLEENLQGIIDMKTSEIQRITQESETKFNELQQ